MRGDGHRLLFNELRALQAQADVLAAGIGQQMRLFERLREPVPLPADDGEALPGPARAADPDPTP